MTEEDFLAAYDPGAFTPIAVASDVALFTTFGGTLYALLVRRSEHPAQSELALPGTFVRADEDTDGAARRALCEKVGLDALVRQFRTFGRIDRDPRMRIVSVAYVALLPHEAIQPVLDEHHVLVALRDGVWHDSDGREVTLPFDHGDILAAAVTSLRVDLDHSAWSYGLLPARFSLRELQQVHEAIRGTHLNKPAFRKRLIESGWIKPTGQMETGKGFRPAELYRVTTEHAR